MARTSRKPPSRRAPALAASLPHDLAPADRVRALEQAFRVLRQFFGRVGASDAELRRAFASAMRSDQLYRVVESQRYELLHGLSDLLATWHREPDYLDATGTPRALGMRGKFSFATLCRRFAPPESPAEIAQFLVSIGVLRCDAAGALRPCRRTALLPTLTAMTLYRVPVVLHGLLETITHNYRCGTDESSKRVERSVFSRGLPVTLVPKFDEKVKRLAVSTVDQLDEWLLRNADAANRDVPRTRVTFNLFAHVESTPARRVSRRRRP